MDPSLLSAAPLGVRVLSRIEQIDAAAWDGCAGAADPFTSHAFLHALEASGSATAAEGWLPRHLVVERDGRVLGVAPLYLKGHSYGEYVFDWSWASASERAGIPYYPKLQCCVPFTPAGGARLLVHPEGDAPVLRRALLAAMMELAELHDASSLHVTFCTAEEQQLAGELGLLARFGIQYHWHNRGYRDFDDFLGALSSRKRKAIKSERRRALATGVRMTTRVGSEITAQHWDRFYGFYVSTIDRKWGSPYLTKDFFHRVGAALGDQVVLVAAEDRGEMVAAALNFRGERALYGRYWGSQAPYRFLHFEACYHRAIELGIELQIERVEAGAQGEHKIQRGYEPVITHSAHWIAHPGLRQAVGSFLERERRAVLEEQRALDEHSPYVRERHAAE